MRKILSLVFLLIVSLSVFSQGSVLGQWKSIEDKTDETKSIVEIFERGGFI